jgi:hypothetical protein
MHYRRSAVGLSLCAVFLTAPIAQAQPIRPDASVNTIVQSSNGRDFVITGGGSAGINLFHKY